MEPIGERNGVQLEPRLRIANGSELGVIAADIDTIALKALGSERTDRYQSARDFQRDCETVLKRYGWEPGSIVDYRAASSFDLVVSLCQGAFGVPGGPAAPRSPAALELDEPILTTMARAVLARSPIATSRVAAVTTRPRPRWSTI